MRSVSESGQDFAYEGNTKIKHGKQVQKSRL